MHLLIQELQDYHRDKALHLARLNDAVRGIAKRDYPADANRELRARFAPFRLDIERLHHHNEELILRELRLTGAPIHRRVDEICGDHEALDRIVAAISEKIANPSADIARLCSDIEQFARIYDDHATGEESIFFPMSDRHLEARHWQRIEKQWDKV